MKYIKYCFFILSVVSIVSCESMFNPVDENLLTEDQINYAPEWAEGILLNAYKGRLDNQYPMDLDAATDNAVHTDQENQYRRVATGEWSAMYTPGYLNRWGMYQDIFYVNKFLTTIENVTWRKDEEANELFKMRLYGEAVGMRALLHLDILLVHGGVGESGELLGIPYYSRFLEYTENFNVPRLSFEATIDSIQADFSEALELLPMDYTDNPEDVPDRYKDNDYEKYKLVFGSNTNLRLSGRMIKAYQARLALFAASPAFLNSSAYYNEAASLAAELINDLGGVGALDPTGSTYYRQTSPKPEMIDRSSVYSSSGPEKNHYPPSLRGKGQLNPSQELVDAFPMKDGYPIDDANGAYAYDANDPYKDRDPRLRLYIIYNGSNALNNRMIHTGIGGGLNRVDSIPGLSTRTGYYVRKGLFDNVNINANGSATDRTRYHVLMRYTEQFLIFAEAANELGGPDHMVDGISARQAIAEIRKRAGIEQPDSYLESVSTKEEMRELIRNERRLELCFEGKRFWDLRRWKLELTESVSGVLFDGSAYQTLNEVEERIYNNAAYYAPIPFGEIRKFDALEQNAGW